MANNAPANANFTQPQRDIIGLIPGLNNRPYVTPLVADGAGGYDTAFVNLRDAINNSVAAAPLPNFDTITLRLNALNLNLRAKIEYIQRRFAYYNSVESLVPELFDKLQNAKLLFDLAIARLTAAGAVGNIENFENALGELEEIAVIIDGIDHLQGPGIPGNPGGGPGGGPGVYPGGNPGGGPGGNGGGGGGNPGNGGLHVLPLVPDHPLVNPLEAGAAANPLRVDPGGGGPPPRRRNALLGALDGLGVNRQGAVAALRDNYERPEEPLEQFDGQPERRGGEMRNLRDRSEFVGGRKRKSKRASKRKMKKTKTKKSRKVTRKQRGGFRYVTKPKTRKRSASSSSSSTSSPMSSARN